MDAAVNNAGGPRNWFGVGRYVAYAIDDLNVIRALILRNLRVQHANNPLGIFVELLRPTAICLVHYFYFAFTKRPVPGHQYAIFTLGGFAIYFAFQAAYSGTFDGGRWPSGATVIPGVTRMHLRVARVCWAFAVHVAFAIAVIVPLLLAGQDVRFPNVPLTLLDFGLAVTLGFGYGMFMNGIGLMFHALVPFLKILQWAVFITSGVYDSLVTMPRVLAQIVWYNPLIHLAEFQRFAYYPGYPTYYVTLAYPLAWAAVLVLTGLLMNRALCNSKSH